MYYEVIYEDGSHSLASYDSEEEMLRAVSEHHRRAKSGEPALPAGQSLARPDVTDAGSPFIELPAARIKKVLAYNEHPADRNGYDELNEKQLNEMFKQANSVPELVAALREHDNATVKSAPHDSNYKMKEEKTYTEGEWDA